MYYFLKRAVIALYKTIKDAPFVKCNASLSQGFRPLIRGCFIVVRNSWDSNIAKEDRL